MNRLRCLSVWQEIDDRLARSLVALQLAAQLVYGGARAYAVGGWGVPLGIDLYADGVAGVMLLLTQAVALALAAYARGYFAATLKQTASIRTVLSHTASKDTGKRAAG